MHTKPNHIQTTRQKCRQHQTPASPKTAVKNRANKHGSCPAVPYATALFRSRPDRQNQIKTYQQTDCWLAPATNRTCWCKKLQWRVPKTQQFLGPWFWISASSFRIVSIEYSFSSNCHRDNGEEEGARNPHKYFGWLVLGAVLGLWGNKSWHSCESSISGVSQGSYRVYAIGSWSSMILTVFGVIQHGEGQAPRKHFFLSTSLLVYLNYLRITAVERQPSGPRQTE